MANPGVYAEAWKNPNNKRSERLFAHRRYLDAAALGETGELLGDKELMFQSNSLVNEGISVQRADGVNLEHTFLCHLVCYNRKSRV